MCSCVSTKSDAGDDSPSARSVRRLRSTAPAHLLWDQVAATTAITATNAARLLDTATDSPATAESLERESRHVRDAYFVKLPSPLLNRVPPGADTAVCDGS